MYYAKLQVRLRCSYEIYPCDAHIVFYEISRCFADIYHFVQSVLNIPLFILLLFIFPLLLTIPFIVLETMLMYFRVRSDKLFSMVVVMELIG